jgi:hypothetical protein
MGYTWERAIKNTIDIMAGCATPLIAAWLCGYLVLNGFSDWYLPSREELNKMYINRAAIGGFMLTSYRSSTESDGSLAWSHDFGKGRVWGTNNKTTLFSVRAIRAF